MNDEEIFFRKQDADAEDAEAAAAAAGEGPRFRPELTFTFEQGVVRGRDQRRTNHFHPFLLQVRKVIHVRRNEVHHFILGLEFARFLLATLLKIFVEKITKNPLLIDLLEAAHNLHRIGTGRLHGIHQRWEELRSEEQRDGRKQRKLVRQLGHEFYVITLYAKYLEDRLDYRLREMPSNESKEKDSDTVLYANFFEDAAGFLGGAFAAFREDVIIHAKNFHIDERLRFGAEEMDVLEQQITLCVEMLFAFEKTMRFVSVRPPLLKVSTGVLAALMRDFFLERKSDGYSSMHWSALHPYWYGFVADLLQAHLEQNESERKRTRIDCQKLVLEFKEAVARIALLVARSVTDPLVVARVVAAYKRHKMRPDMPGGKEGPPIKIGNLLDLLLTQIDVATYFMLQSYVALVRAVCLGHDPKFLFLLHFDTSDFVSGAFDLPGFEGASSMQSMRSSAYEQGRKFGLGPHNDGKDALLVTGPGICAGAVKWAREQQLRREFAETGNVFVKKEFDPTDVRNKTYAYTTVFDRFTAATVSDGSAIPKNPDDATLSASFYDSKWLFTLAKTDRENMRDTKHPLEEYLWSMLKGFEKRIFQVFEDYFYKKLSEFQLYCAKPEKGFDQPTGFLYGVDDRIFYEGIEFSKKQLPKEAHIEEGHLVDNQGRRIDGKSPALQPRPRPPRSDRGASSRKKTSADDSDDESSDGDRSMSTSGPQVRPRRSGRLPSGASRSGPSGMDAPAPRKRQKPSTAQTGLESTMATGALQHTSDGNMPSFTSKAPGGSEENSEDGSQAPAAAPSTGRATDIKGLVIPRPTEGAYSEQQPASAFVSTKLAADSSKGSSNPGFGQASGETAGSAGGSGSAGSEAPPAAAPAKAKAKAASPVPDLARPSFPGLGSQQPRSFLTSQQPASQAALGYPEPQSFFKRSTTTPSAEAHGVAASGTSKSSSSSDQQRPKERRNENDVVTLKRRTAAAEEVKVAMREGKTWSGLSLKEDAACGHERMDADSRTKRVRFGDRDEQAFDLEKGKKQDRDTPAGGDQKRKKKARDLRDREAELQAVMEGTSYSLMQLLSENMKAGTLVGSGKKSRKSSRRKSIASVERDEKESDNRAGSCKEEDEAEVKEGNKNEQHAAKKKRSGKRAKKVPRADGTYSYDGEGRKRPDGSASRLPRRERSPDASDASEDGDFSKTRTPQQNIADQEALLKDAVHLKPQFLFYPDEREKKRKHDVQSRKLDLQSPVVVKKDLTALVRGGKQIKGGRRRKPSASSTSRSPAKSKAKRTKNKTRRAASLPSPGETSDAHASAEPAPAGGIPAPISQQFLFFDEKEDFLMARERDDFEDHQYDLYQRYLNAVDAAYAAVQRRNDKNVAEFWDGQEPLWRESIDSRYDGDYIAGKGFVASLKDKADRLMGREPGDHGKDGGKKKKLIEFDLDDKKAHKGHFFLGEHGPDHHAADMRKEFLLKLRGGLTQNTKRQFHPDLGRRRSEQARKVLDMIGIKDTAKTMPAAPPELMKEEVVSKLASMMLTDLVPILAYEDAGTRKKPKGREDMQVMEGVGAVLHFRDLLDFGTSMGMIILEIYQTFGVFELEVSADDFRDLEDLEELIIAHVQTAYVTVMSGVLERCQEMPDPDSRARGLKIAFYYVLSLVLRIVEDLKLSKAIALGGYFSREIVKRFNNSVKPPDFKHMQIPPATEALFRYFLLTWKKNPPVAGTHSPVVQLLARQILQATAQLATSQEQFVDAVLAMDEKGRTMGNMSRAINYSVEFFDYPHLLEYAEDYILLLCDFTHWMVMAKPGMFPLPHRQQIVDALFHLAHQTIEIFLDAFQSQRKKTVVADLTEILMEAGKACSVGGAVSWIRRDIAHLFSTQHFPNTSVRCVTPRARYLYYQVGRISQFMNDGKEYINQSIKWERVAEDFEFVIYQSVAMLFTLAETSPSLEAFPLALEVAALECAEAVVPEFRKMYEAKFVPNGYSLGQFVYAVHELMRKDIRLLDYKTAKLDRLHRLFLDEIKSHLENMSELIVSLMANHHRLFLDEIKSHLENINAASHMMFSPGGGSSSTGDGTTDHNGSSADEAHLRVILNFILNAPDDEDHLDEVDLTALIFPIRGVISEICHQAGLAPQMKYSVLHKYLVYVCHYLKKFMDRKPDLPKFKSQAMLAGLKTLVARLTQECYPDHAQMHIPPSVEYLHGIRMQMFEDAGALRETFYSRIREEDQYLVPAYCQELFQEALAVLYPENLLR